MEIPLMYRTFSDSPGRSSLYVSKWAMEANRRNTKHSCALGEVFSFCVCVWTRLFYEFLVEYEVRSTVLTVQLFSLINNNRRHIYWECMLCQTLSLAWYMASPQLILTTIPWHRYYHPYFLREEMGVKWLSKYPEIPGLLSALAESGFEPLSVDLGSQGSYSTCTAPHYVISTL